MLFPLNASVTLEDAGGKGLNLSRLVQSGFPVPGGFIISTAAYRQFVAENGLAQVIQSRLETVALDNPAGLEQVSSVIRSRFSLGQIPSDLKASIRNSYRAMGGSPVAVRSSATAEDLPELSFAGQQDTFLNIIGENSLLQAIVQCWSSLWTARAIGYRVRNGLSQQNLSLAVIVQDMVASHASGVAFTANPLTGQRTCTVIDATLGLGEALVSGQVEPDHYEVDMLSARITHKILGAKALALHGKAAGGLERRNSDASLVQALPDEQILTLATLCDRVQANFGFPQDIEWAWDGIKLHLLQSRPITSLYPTPQGMPLYPLRTMFSFAAVQGILEPITPLGQDAIRIALTGLAGLFGYQLNYDQDGFVFVAGERLWLAFTSLYKNRVGRRLVQGVLSLVEPTIGQALQSTLADPMLQPSGGFSLRLVPHLLCFAMPVIPRILLALLFPHWRRRRGLQVAKNSLASLRAQSDAIQGDPYQKLAQCLELLKDIRGDFLRRLPRYFIAPLAAGMASMNFTNQILARTLGSTSGGLEGMKEIMFRLTRGMPYNVTTEMDLTLWETAQTIRQDPESALFFTGQPVDTLAEAYHHNRLPSLADGEILSFMAQYGMRGPGEIDMGRPRWHENPVQIMQVLASYLQITDPSRAPDAVFHAGAREAQASLDRLAAQIRQLPHGRIKARLFRFASGRMRQLVGLRESPKFFIVRTMGIIRQAFLQSAKELVALGDLEQPQDIFFLRVKDLEALARREPHDWRSLVARNRSAADREKRRRQVPILLFSDGRAFYGGSAPDESEPPSTGRLTGSPVSAGVVEGNVRLVFSPHETALLPGEILVCPGTDPAWTPLFLSAGGLVMEVGGMMTHGAVVAREYGIPAVVGVAQATRRLKTGQRIRLDGTRGEIVILDG